MNPLARLGQKMPMCSTYKLQLFFSFHICASQRFQNGIFAMQKEQELHEMAAIKIPTNGGGGRKVAFPSWSETKNRWADSMQVLQGSGCSLFTSKYFKTSLRPSGQLFCDMGCLFKGTMALLQGARFVAIGPAALERSGWR